LFGGAVEIHVGGLDESGGGSVAVVRITVEAVQRGKNAGGCDAENRTATIGLHGNADGTCAAFAGGSVEISVAGLHQTVI
jgi:hypothetical protein